MTFCLPTSPLSTQGQGAKEAEQECYDTMLDLLKSGIHHLFYKKRFYCKDKKDEVLIY